MEIHSLGLGPRSQAGDSWANWADTGVGAGWQQHCLLWLKQELWGSPEIMLILELLCSGG